MQRNTLPPPPPPTLPPRKRNGKSRLMRPLKSVIAGLIAFLLVLILIGYLVDDDGTENTSNVVVAGSATTTVTESPTPASTSTVAIADSKPTTVETSIATATSSPTVILSTPSAAPTATLAAPTPASTSAAIPTPTPTQITTPTPTPTSPTQGWTVQIAQERTAGYSRPSGNHGGRCGSGQDLDHVVPLLEAWESGINNLSSFNRYTANHLCMPSSANRSKGSSEPHEWHSKPKFAAWLNANPKVECQMIRQWAHVKQQQNMTADSTEYRYVTTALQRCGQGSALPAPPAVSASQVEEPSDTCIHWHAGNPKHEHPNPNISHSHQSGKCAGY